MSMMMDSIITLYMSTTFCDDSVITESISSCKTQQFFVLFTTRVNNRRVTVHVTVNESTLLSNVMTMESIIMDSVIILSTKHHVASILKHHVASI